MTMGSGVIVSTKFNFDNFTAINVGSVCELKVIEGSEFSIDVSCDDNIVDYLIVKVESESLDISLMPYSGYKQITFKAAVTMPALTSLTVRDASDAVVSGFNVPDVFSLSVSDAANAEISFVAVEDISAVITDASDCKVTAASMSGDLYLTAKDASDADFRSCYVNDAVVEISDASAAWLNLSGRLTGRVTDASSLFYRGTSNVNGVNVVFPSKMTLF